jgi:transposase
MKNKFIKRTHIFERKFREILKLFCVEIEAKIVADLTSVNRNTINKYFVLLSLMTRISCLKEYLKWTDFKWTLPLLLYP